MSMQSVTMVRVYLTEGRLLDELVKFLHDESNVQGVTVFRGITGFGKSGHMHSSKTHRHGLRATGHHRILRYTGQSDWYRHRA